MIQQHKIENKDRQNSKAYRCDRQRTDIIDFRIGYAIVIMIKETKKPKGNKNLEKVIPSRC